MTRRAVKEWIGKTPESKAPSRVRLRIFDREKGRCHICKQPIQAGQKWEADHVPALINGGKNRESKIFPAHVKCHRSKTDADVAEKSKTNAVRGKHVGAIQPKAKIKSAGFAKTEKFRKIDRSVLPELPRRSLFAGKE